MMLHIKKQRGATLVVALIILLVMSVIGISTMKSSTLQERMAGNARQKAISKNAAMVAMREAELWLRANIPDYPLVPSLNNFNGNNGLYSAVNRPSAAAVPVPAAFDVTDPDDWTAVGVSSAAVSGSLVSQQPKYIIEYLGRDVRGESAVPVVSFDDEEKNNLSVRSHLFRITAIGWAKDANITTVLQSTYVTGVK